MTSQAITTKFIPASNTRGSRVKATAYGGSVTLNYEHDLNSEENHTQAAVVLIKKMKWKGQWFAGGLPNDAGYCFVCSHKGEQPIVDFNND